MASTGAKFLVQYVLLAICLMALVGGGKAFYLCSIDSHKLSDCLPAVSGKFPQPPNKNCCAVVRQANLPCLCNYKAALPAFGIDPALAVDLPNKCGLETPRECHVP